MGGAETTLLILLVILFLGLAVSELFEKLHLPSVTSIILVGAIFGPHGIGWVESNEVIAFFGFLGVTFLMLMAGLETQVDYLKHSVGKVLILASLNGLIPFVTGFVIAMAFGYDMTASLVLGTIFVSSSIAIIVPAMQGLGMAKNIPGQLIISTVVILDAISLFVLAILLQGEGSGIPLPLPVYILLLLALSFLVKIFLPKIAGFFLHRPAFQRNPRHQDQLRFIIIALISVLLLFSALGVHPILAAFIVGIVLADTVTSEKILTKIRTLGYGLFVPVFFFIVGMEMDLSIFANVDFTSSILVAIVLGVIIAKVGSGYIAGRLVHMSSRNAWMFGIISTAQLTTTLAATYAAATEGIIDSELTTAVILLSIITTLGAPVLLELLARGKRT